MMTIKIIIILSSRLPPPPRWQYSLEFESNCPFAVYGMLWEKKVPTKNKFSICFLCIGQGKNIKIIIIGQDIQIQAEENGKRVTDK